MRKPHSPSAPLLWALALGVSGSAGCADKSSTIDTADTGSEGGEGSGSDASGDAVWDDLRLESSVTLSGGFASGAGFYAIGEDGEVYVRSEGTWRQEGVDAGEPLNGIWGIRTADVNYAVSVGDGGIVSRLDDGGWSTNQELNTANMEAIDSIDGSTFVAVGWGGAYRYESGAWSFQNIEGNPQFNDVWSDGTTTVAVGQDGVIAVSSGGDWSVENLPSRVALNGVSGTSSSNLWIAGEDGTLLHNTGSGWEEVDSGTSATLWAVESISTSATYVVGNNGYAFRHDGSDLTVLPTGADNNLYDVTASGSGVIWAVGNRGATMRLQQGY